MNKTIQYIAGGVVVVAVGLYVFISGKSSSATETAQTPTTSTTETASAGSAPGTGGTSAGSESINPNAVGTDTSGNTSGSANSGSATPATAYKDGTYKGTVADATYGSMQVAVTIAGGKITAVTTPVYPNDRGETSEVSAHALPILKQETLAAQSAQIDVVSGATQSSEAFQQSLAAALQSAQG
jgi:uncharacterized protein with FMN-binding domain